MSAKPAMSGAGGPEMFECAMCLDDLVVKKGSSVTCGCGTTVCTGCVKDYLMHTTEEAHCMKCKRAWDRATQYAYLGPKFVNGPYRKHHKTFLLNKEKLRLPETMALIAAEKEKEAMIDVVVKEFNRLNTEYAKKKAEIRVLCDTEVLATAEGKQFNSAEVIINAEQVLFNKAERRYLQAKRVYDKIRDATHPTRQKIYNKWGVKHAATDRHYGPLIKEARQTVSTLQGKKAPKKKVVFARRCPDEECRGFLAPNNKCGLCDKFSCGKCMKIVGDEPAADDETHECNPDDVASVQMLKKETRPCPKCITPIYKISGCDQMWCTQCHVAFSWITGKIVVNDRMHNPHYYDFLREHGAGAIRTPEEVVCGGIPTARRIIGRFNDVAVHITNKKVGKKAKILTLIPKLVDAHRFAGHLTAIILAPLRRTARTESDNEKLRKRFMKGEIDEARLVSNLSRRDNVRTKNIEILRVLEITNTVMVENFNTFMTHKANNSALVWIDRINTLNASLEAIRMFTNTQMMKISSLFNMNVPLITNAWVDISVRMNPGLERLGTATAISGAKTFSRFRCRR